MIKFSLLFHSLLILASCSNFLDLDQSESSEFEDFIEKFSKSYKNQEEYSQRKKIFINNSKLIRESNLKGLSWSLGLNEFSDLTSSEFSSKFLMKESIPIHSGDLQFPNDLSLPISIDWRAKGVVTPVINQGSCSCGYAVASAGALEGAWALNGHKLPLLSIQQIIDCSTGNKGCTSGTGYNSLKYISLSGLANSTVYPYLASANRCNKTAAALMTAKASSYLNVTSNSATALKSAIVLQPVTVGVSAQAAIWQSYAGGVVNSTTCGTTVNHFVLAVGYNTAGTVPYYIVKNSWGPAWGKEGFMELAIVDGPGICAVQTMASYPVV
jgi:C1A family cysteine protease